MKIDTFWDEQVLKMLLEPYKPGPMRPIKLKWSANVLSSKGQHEDLRKVRKEE